MAVTINNTGYNGELLTKLVTKAMLGNEVFQKGLIHMEYLQGADKGWIPRLKTGTMLGKVKEQPVDGDSKGDFTLDDKPMTPQEFMAFTTFNPKTFQKYWREYQPTGPLVFAELPAEGRQKLLEAMMKQVNFELGTHFVNGEFVDGTDDTKLFDGIVTTLRNDADVIDVTSPLDLTESNIIGEIKRTYDLIPDEIRDNPNLKLVISKQAARLYDDALTNLPNKGKDITTKNSKFFKDIPLADVSALHKDIFYFTVCGPSEDSNIWGCGDYVNDYDVIQIDKLTNAGERYFFKMKMKATTGIAFGEHTVLYDGSAAV